MNEMNTALNNQCEVHAKRLPRVQCVLKKYLNTQYLSSEEVEQNQKTSKFQKGKSQTQLKEGQDRQQEEERENDSKGYLQTKTEQ